MDGSAAASFNSHKRHGTGSQSSPLFFNKKLDLPDVTIRELQPSSTKKFHTYVLPTPGDAKLSASTGSVSPVSTARLGNRAAASTQLWHSSPLERYKFVKNSRDDEFSSLTKFPKVHTAVLKESNINSGPIRISPPLREQLSMPRSNQWSGVDTKKMRYQSSSGPLTSSWSNNPNVSAPDLMPSLERPRTASAMPAPAHASRPSLSPKVTPNISPPPIRSPQISELHELPRPPTGSARSTRPVSMIGYSAPLLYRGPDLNKATKTSPIVSHTASPLPTPPAAVHRSYSIPSRRKLLSPVAKFLDDPHNVSFTEDVASPPLTPMSLTNLHPTSQSSSLVT